MKSIRWFIVWAMLVAAFPLRGDDTPFSFVVFGDNQCATGNPTSGVPERMAIPKLILRLDPDFVLHTGDLMDHGRDADAYERFSEYYRELLAAIPFFPTMGNHDAGYAGIVNYRSFLSRQLTQGNTASYGDGYGKHFAVWFDDDPLDYPVRFDDPRVRQFKDRVPSGVTFKTYYAFRFRNAYFISCEQGTRWWANTPKPWLEHHLKQAHQDPAIDHTFVYLHHPIYSSTMRETPPDPAKPGSGECLQPVRKHFEPLLRKYDATAVFSGHAHLYDRFHVPDDGHETRSSQSTDRYTHDGTSVHYIVTGGGGGALNRGDWVKDHSYQYFQTRKCAYHVTRVQISRKKLTVTAHSVQGTAGTFRTHEFDRFTIEP